jgi:hypothetical protein
MSVRKSRNENPPKKKFLRKEKNTLQNIRVINLDYGVQGMPSISKIIR